MASILAVNDRVSMRTVVTVSMQAVRHDGIAASDAIAALALADRLRIARNVPHRCASALNHVPLSERPHGRSIPAVLLIARRAAKREPVVCEAGTTTWVGKLLGADPLMGFISGIAGLAS